MSLRPIAFVLLLTLASPLASFAQTVSPNRVFGRYQQFVWDEQHGLPQNTVLGIAPTRDGYVWIATFEGVARFDGVRFTLFNTANTNAIGNPMISALLEDRAGNLWIGTYGGGLTRFSRGQFTRYTTADGLATDFIASLFEDRDGNLWIGTESAGVNRWRDGRFTRLTTEDGLPNNLVRVMTDDGDGGVLLGTARGIVRLKGDRITTVALPQGLQQLDVFDLKVAPDRALWLSARSGVYRIRDDHVTRFGPQDGLTADLIESLRVDSSGEVWMGSHADGLFRYVRGRFEQYSIAEGLPGGRVTKMIEDGRGGRWLGTDAGLVRLDAPRFTVYTARNGLPFDRVGEIVQDVDGRVWVNSSGTLVRFDNGQFKVMTTEHGLPQGRLRQMGPDSRGSLLVLTAGGLARWTADRFVTLDDVIGVGVDRVTAMLRDRDGDLWLGIQDEGVVRVGGGKRTHFTIQQGLADNSVTNLFEDRAGNIWIATLRGGITRIVDEHVTSWSTRDGLADNHVKAFYQDADGVLWIATHGGGVSRFKDGKFSTIGSRHGLYNDVVFRILEDDDGNLWMNCNRGIWRTSRAELNAFADGQRVAVTSFGYGLADGMLSSEGVGANIAGWKMRDGSLWFPTIRGVVVIDPRRRDSAPPQVVIESVTVDRQPVPIGQSLQLHPGHENVEIQYTGLAASRPHAIAFRFRMAGLDRDWVEAGTRRTAYYSHLPPGAYTFTVMADNGDGVWNAAGGSLAVIVLPPVYRTWWFITLSAVGMAAMVGLGWNYRVSQLKRTHAARQEFLRELMASQERERQRIAAELHDGLGQRLVVIKNLATLSLEPSVGRDQSRRQIEEIASETSAAIKEVREVSYNLRPYQLDNLGLRKALEALIKTTASASRIDFTYNIGEIDHVLPGDQEISFYRIVQESLNNIVKHAQARTATVKVSRSDHHLVLFIQDDGIGFTPNPTGGDGQPSGFGLVGINERVESLGGRMTIRSAPSQGTTIGIDIELRGTRHGD